MKIVFVSDFLYHSLDFKDTYHYWSIDLFNPIIEAVTNQQVVELKNLRNNNGEFFSRVKFYELSNISDITDSYYNYEIKKISQDSINYLKSFLNRDTFIIGIELGKELRQLLTSLGCPLISLWFHSWKMFDDAFFMINTNSKDIFEILSKYKVPKLKFDFYAKYWTIWKQQKREGIKDSNIQENSVVFIGQTLRDKSTDDNGKYLNILDFKEEILKLSKEYSHIYYVPHPYVAQNKEIDKYLNETKYITKITSIPTYELLMSPKIKKVVSISSSVLYEAKFFGKEIQYLFKPLFNIDGNFDDDTWTSIYQDYFNPKFWHDIFELYMTVNHEYLNENLFYEADNKFRNIKNLYYGYEKFNDTRITRLELLEKINQTNSKINDFNKQLASFKEQVVIAMRYNTVKVWRNRTKQIIYKTLFKITNNKKFYEKYKEIEDKLKYASFQ